MTRRTGALLSLAAAAFAFCTAARADDLVFLSTQLRPIESAQAMRNDILKGFSGGPVSFVAEVPPQLGVHVRAEAQAGKHVTSLIGALHGELMPLAATNNLAPLDDLAAQLKDRGISDAMMDAAKLGTAHTLYIPWMQATYIMAASKQALPYLPDGADINHLTYAQLAQWGANIQAKTGKRMIGFPAGPQGLMPRFFEGYLYPSYTGGVVRTFRSADAETMWTDFRDLWKYVNPNSTNYGFMQEPLMSGDVWIAFDHVARLIDALSKKPDEFVAFPAPAGPKGRGFMPVVAGLSIADGAPDAAGARKLIAYLTQPDVQIRTARSVAFFPVVKAELPSDLPPGLRMEVDAVQKMEGAPDALTAFLPIGLDQRGGEFDKVFMDTFQLIVLRGQAPRAVLDREGDAMKRIMTETKAPCWKPDAPSEGACPVD
jgi:multiple sugar transport system substrate-binding protein